jgi:hypothetical protein
VVGRVGALGARRRRRAHDDRGANQLQRAELGHARRKRRVVCQPLQILPRRARAHVAPPPLCAAAVRLLQEAFQDIVGGGHCGPGSRGVQSDADDDEPCL